MKYYLKLFTLSFLVTWIIAVLCIAAIFYFFNMQTSFPAIIPLVTALFVANENIVQKFKKNHANQIMGDAFRKRMILFTALIATSVQFIPLSCVAVYIKVAMHQMNKNIAAISNPKMHALALQEKAQLMTNNHVLHFYASWSWLPLIILALSITFCVTVLIQLLGLRAKKFKAKKDAIA